MFKYIKYFLPSFLVVMLVLFYLQGTFYPTLFLLIYSFIIIIGDLFVRDTQIQKFSYPNILNLSIYVNLPILFILVFFVVSIFSSHLPIWYIDGFKAIFNIDFFELRESFNLIDKISIMIHTGLFIGSLGTVSAHELTHRKKDKFDMFVGNWLLSFSWDCNFAIEHVYGHHKNVCLPEDPASAKRGENIYWFTVKGIVNEQISGWEIESNRLQRKKISKFSIQNRMIIGYMRSFSITILIFMFGGIGGMFIFLLSSLLAKVFLEAINYIEHYGLVRERGKPVRMRHSWNSNHFFSSIYLYNVTRHSDHHRNTSLKFWELKPVDKDAPMLPYGYLTMLYLALFIPFLYNRIMKKELINWDQNYANDFERSLVRNYFI
ncbi:MAG: hypothetical protein CMG64_06605 [Candidatus Marinimicrobia bacterium]|nr:hypothetical protein [Candidatus Neomarinimicrobiota bacterium]|tara:strand:- start:2143 stop:3270 length:1128 start_codon:yes stop_codon:yes gene_type:complete